MPRHKRKYKIIDLFAGAGGLSLGASRAGFNVAAAIEWDIYASETHSINFPKTIHIKEDIMGLTGKQILRLSKLKGDELIGVIGGPPCQGFSSIGHGDVADNRNQLFIKFFDLVNEMQPLFFLAENVPGILNKKFSGIREEAFKKLQNYTILPAMEIHANEFGAPTTRTRIFFFGFRQTDSIKEITSDDFMNAKVSMTLRTNVNNALEGLPDHIVYKKNSSGIRKLKDEYIIKPENQNEYFYSRVVGLIPSKIGCPTYIAKFNKKHTVNGCLPTKHSDIVRNRYKCLAYGQQDKISKSVRLDPNGYCPTLRAGTGPDKGSYQAVRPIHFKHPRVITPREAARLQGFPDWFYLPNTIWHSFRQIGNSVSPIVAERILSVIYQKLT